MCGRGNTRIADLSGTQGRTTSICCGYYEGVLSGSRMKIVTVIGARPQFIKAAPVSKAFKEAGITEFLVHTGQHYDYGMSRVFFEEMNIPEPNVNLSVGSGNHGWQTAQILIGIENVL